MEQPKEKMEAQNNRPLPEKSEKRLKEAESTSKLQIETSFLSETKAVINIEIDEAILKAEREKLLNQEQVKQKQLQDQITQLHKQVEQQKKTESALFSRIKDIETKIQKQTFEKDEIVKKEMVKQKELENCMAVLQKENEQLRKSEEMVKRKELEKQMTLLQNDVGRLSSSEARKQQKIHLQTLRESKIFFVIEQLARKITTLEMESKDDLLATETGNIDIVKIVSDLKLKASSEKKEDLWSWLLRTLHIKENVDVLPTEEKRKSKPKRKAPHIASIDFGTCFCTWAYTVSDEALGSDEYEDAPVVSKKVPTSALINPDGQTLKSFGYEAEQTYRNLAAEDKHKKFYFFQRFKMILDKEKISQDTALEDIMGKKLPAKTVFKVSIEYISKEALKLGKETKGDTSQEIKRDEVQWTISVPGTWSDAAKQFMREAATEAHLDTNYVDIALDSEAAAVFCQNPSCSADEIPMTEFEKGTKYIIIDAGGGKVDMTAHEVSGKGDLKEIHAGTGHSMGGNVVNEAFFGILEDVFGKEVFGKFKNEGTVEWLKLSDEFEERKKTFQSSCTAVEIEMPPLLIKFYEETTKTNISTWHPHEKYSSNIKMNGYKMVIDSSLMRSLFEKPVTETVACIKSILAKVGQVDVIFMVGGFSASPILQQLMKTEFAETKIINRDGDAVAAGAVIVGPNPHLITQRILKKTYGIEATTYFVKELHPESRKSLKDGKEWIHKVFSKHVEKGQTVTVGEIQKEEYYNPFYPNQPTILFHVFASDEKDPMYTDEGCTHIGMATLNISDVPGDMEREIAVSLTFDESEIKVKARETKTGKEVIGKCNFLG